MRINLSKPDADKAKAIICEMIRASDGEFRGQTRLYKGFYFAHLFHWCKQNGTLSKYPIARMPNGPGIDDGDWLLHEMVSEGLISKQVQYAGPYPETVFRLIEPNQCGFDLSGAELASVRDAAEFIRGKSATELSDLTHEHSRSWNGGKNGDVLDPYVDLLDEDDYRSIQKRQADAARLINSVFGEGFVRRPC